MPMSCDVLLTMSRRLDVVGYFVGLLTESQSRSRLVDGPCFLAVSRRLDLVGSVPIKLSVHCLSPKDSG